MVYAQDPARPEMMISERGFNYFSPNLSASMCFDYLFKRASSNLILEQSAYPGCINGLDMANEVSIHGSKK
jgi:hypothetical protein